MKTRALAAAFLMTLAATTAHAELSISNNPTSSVSCSGGVCSATAANAVLNVGDLAGMLASGDVTVKTGTVARDIEIKQTLSWTSISRLTLDAQRSVSVENLVTIAGSGALTVTSNDGGSGGDLQIAAPINFWDTGASLVINGQSYTLVGDIATLANDASTDPNGHFALAKDYDATADGTYGSAPVGYLEGTFNGLGHTIAHLTIAGTAKQECGLFIALQPNAVLRDLALSNVSVSCSNKDAGTFAAYSNATVSNLRADGTVSALNYAGGLFAQAGGAISRARADVAVSGHVAGGLVGYQGGGLILQSQATGTVSGVEAGGLIGSGADFQVAQSFATGNITLPFGATYAGGLTGGYFHNLAAGPISDSYARGSVQGGYAGGFAAQIYPQMAISNVYSTGAVAGQSGTLTGGFAGASHAKTYQNAYWDTDSSGTTKGCGKGGCSALQGLGDAQLKSGLPTGFDPAIWGQSSSINDGYPYLLANPPR